MKKTATLIVGCLVLILIVVSGCNSSTSQAKSFMQKGDALLQAGSKKVELLGPKAQTVISSIADDLEAGNLPGKATAQKAFDELKSVTIPIEVNYARAKLHN